MVGIQLGSFEREVAMVGIPISIVTLHSYIQVVVVPSSMPL